jgi:hypothetical protein
MAAATLIGAKGLKGNSWPDLDMLPFGWLTDAGDKTRNLDSVKHSLLIKRLVEIWILNLFFLFIAVNEGPHRSCRLTLEEQRTQVLMNSTTELLSYIFLMQLCACIACIMIYILINLLLSHR